MSYDHLSDPILKIVYSFFGYLFVVGRFYCHGEIVEEIIDHNLEENI